MEDRPWALSSSDDSDSDRGSSSSSSGVAAALRILSPRKRGRPRKYAHGSTRTERRHLLADARARAVTGESLPHDAVSSPASAPVDILASYLRPVGDDMSVLVAKTVQKRYGMDVGDGTRKIIAQFLSAPAKSDPDPSRMVRLMATGALSRVLAMPRRTVQRKLVTSAAAVYIGSRALASSLVSTALRCERAGKLKVVACFKNIFYDETPLTLRANKESGAVCHKLFQSEVQFAIVTQSLQEPHIFACSLVTLPQIVQSLRRGTGAVLKKALDRSCELPFWRDLETRCEDVFACDVSCADRASANNVAEDLTYAETTDVARARFPCYAHIAATSQGRGLSSCSDDITGLISASLQMRSAGATTEFRNCIVQVLLSAINDVLDAAPLPPDAECNVYLAAFLRATMPGTDEGFRRGKELSRLLMSDIREPGIVLRVPGTMLDRSEWAHAVANNLLPAGIKIFPRHRWCNSLETIAEFTLLAGVHDVLHRAGKLWLGDGQKVSAPVAKAVVGVEPSWAVSDDEVEQETATSQLVLANSKEAGAVSEKDPTSVWTEFNKNQRSKALRFVASRPGDRLVVVLVALQLSVLFLRTVEHIGSDKFQMAAWQKTSQGEYTSRVLTVWEGCLERVVEDTMARLRMLSTWCCVRPAARRAGLASRAFSLIYVVRCALEQLALVSTRGLPFGLWELVARPCLQIAQTLLEEPKCMQDEFTRLFLARFDTAAKLCSGAARAVLIAMSIFVCLDICRIECRHGMLKKYINSSATWKPLLQEISAKFVLMRSRVLESIFKPEADAAAERKPEPARKTCKVKRKVKVKGKVRYTTYTKNTGGGGGQRAFVGSWIRGKKIPTPEVRQQLFKEAHFEYLATLQRGGQACASLKQEGVAGMVSHRAGARAFRGRQRWPLKKRELATRTGRAVPVHAGGLVQHPSLMLVNRTTLGDFGEETPSVLRREQAARAQRDIRETLARSKASLATCADAIWAPAAAAGGLGLQQIHHSPVVDEVKFHMDCFWLTPPAKDIATRVLDAASHHAHADPKRYDAVAAKLDTAWDELHNVVDAPEQPKAQRREMPTNKRSLHAISVCRRAGVCLCGEAMAKRRAFRESVGKTLKSFLVKGSAVRALYDKGLVVLRVRGLRVNVEAVESFFFLGYGNLNDLDFTVQLLILKQAAVQASGVYMLQADATTRPQDHDVIGAVVFGSVDVVHCDIDIWKLDLECMEPLAQFEPLAAASATVPLITARVWPLPETKRAQRQTLPVRPLKALLGGRQAPVAAEEADHDADRAVDDPVAEEDQRCILDIVAEELYEAAGIPAGVWNVSSDEEDDDEGDGSQEEGHPGAVSDPVVPGGGSHRNSLLACLRHGPRLAEGRAPPPPVPDVLAPCRDRRAAWPKVIASHSSGSYLRLSQTWGKQHWDCRAICREHGPDVSCTRTRNMREWRPVGRLWWWLQAGQGLSYEDHQKCPCLITSNELF